MKSLKVSQRAQRVIASPIRKFLPLMREAESRGTKVFRLNVGDPDFSIPPAFLKVIKNYKLQTLSYAPSPGIKEHSLAWQTYYRKFGVELPVTSILPTQGGAEAIMLALQAVADHGDEVIVFEPLYTSYKSFSVMAGVKLVPITLLIENNFALPRASVIESKITKRTKAIVVINPDNPTGKLWTSAELKTLVNLAKKHNLFLISDETYREIRFTGRPYCILSDKSARENLILVDSVSKRFSIPGARIGCLASFNQDVMVGILKFAQARLSAGTLEQLGLVPLLKNSKPYTSKITAEYKKRQKVVVEGLRKIKGAVFQPAQGAFYQTVKLPIKDSEAFVKFMIGEFIYKGATVMATPMKDFYITPGKGTQEIRIAYVLNVKDLKRAMDILARGVEEFNKKYKV